MPVAALRGVTCTRSTLPYACLTLTRLNCHFCFVLIYLIRLFRRSLVLLSLLARNFALENPFACKQSNYTCSLGLNTKQIRWTAFSWIPWLPFPFKLRLSVDLFTLFSSFYYLGLQQKPRRINFTCIRFWQKKFPRIPHLTNFQLSAAKLKPRSCSRATIK